MRRLKPIKDVNNQIAQLLPLLSTNIECCETIVEFCKDLKRTNTDNHTLLFLKGHISYLNLLSYNHFFEAISLIKALLCPTNPNKEISFLNKNVRIKKDTLEQIEELQKKFIKSNINILRGSISAHKNSNSFSSVVNFIF